jgi:hypothetical protein
MSGTMRTGVCILVGAALIAAAILVTGRYSIGHVSTGSQGFTVYGIDEWTGAGFMRETMTN